MLKHLFTLDEEANAVLKTLPQKKKSAFVREAIKLKARMLEESTKPPVKKVKISI